MQGGLARPAASIIEQKGPKSLCLPLWLAGWLVGSASVLLLLLLPWPATTIAGLAPESQLLDQCQQPVCSTPLIYVHWRWCKVVEKLYSITAPLACQATVTAKWVRGVRRSEEWMEWWGWERSPGGYVRYRHLIVPSSMRLNSNHSHTIPMHLQT